MTSLRRFPETRPLIAYYGDDLSGSASSMEVTAFAGLKTVLFLGPPSRERLAQFAGYDVIGIAGTARAQSPAWMETNLPPVFRLLKSLHAPVIRYKVCSTFDSSPQTGSIGKAIDIAAPFFSGWIPLIVADPGMARFQAFGNLFAMANGIGCRLDRHPTMARHPITPMDEADLGRHLARQTERRTGLVDFVAMKRGAGEERLAEEIDRGAEIISLDVLDRETLVAAGALVWERGGEPVFGVGSQGFEAALVAYWQAQGFIEPSPPLPKFSSAGQLACVSGSVSPITAKQIETAASQGFATIPIAAEYAVDVAAWPGEVERTSERALRAIGEGRDVLVYSASGPDDPAVAAFRSAIQVSGVPSGTAYERLGVGLGTILDRMVRAGNLKRAIIGGGDTSGQAAAMLGIDALTAIAPLVPGAPLCLAHSRNEERARLELVMKGGQMGAPDFFLKAKQGTA